MTLTDIVHHLPTEPPQEMMDWAKTMVEFDTEYILFYQDIVCESNGYEQFGIEKFVPRRGAKCCCTACGEVFDAGWASNPKARMKGITITLAPNGMWPGYCAPDDEYAYVIPEGQEMNCPYCGCSAQLMHKASMPNGRTFQIKLVNVGTVGKYAVIYSWLYRRTLFNDGSEQRDIRPATAYVVTEKGYLHQYNHVKQTGYGGTSDLPQWERAKSLRGDPMLDLYYSYDAACHKQVGGRVWEQVPSLAGSTAEKTGLEEYLLCGGCFPVAYMQEWKKHPYIENLQKSGFGGQVADDIDLQINNHLGYGHRSGKVHIEWADLLKARPCDQLGMTKEEMRRLSETWNINMLENWAHYRYCSGQISATAYDAHRRVIGEDALTKLTAAACEMVDEGWLDKAARYLAKQVNTVDLAATAAEHLCDLWDMLEQREATGDIITDRELWPRNLQEAHDREINRIHEAEYAKTDPEFVKVAAKYAALEWTDGDLCIRLPRSNKELVEEGKVLRHCVGSYGTRHISESVIVFFVRHYRRPERSYYTMDYSFGKYGEYRRNQLHGYGNEHHGEYKQFSHRIPLKVIAFVERWEREVLGPWIARQAAEATRKGRKKKSA